MKKILVIPIVLIIFAIGMISLSEIIFPTIDVAPKLTPVESDSFETASIRIGTIGDSASKLILRFQPTADYLADHLSDEQIQYSGKVVIAKTIESMISLLNNNEIDVFVDSPFTTVTIMNSAEINPSLIRWKQESQFYHTVFLSRENFNIISINDPNIVTWIFETKESTSGYLLPLTYLYDLEILSSTNKQSSFIFSGEDMNSAVWLIEEKGDVAMMSNLDFDDLPTTIQSQLKIIDQTNDVSRHVISYNSNLDQNVSEKITKILLDMDNDPQGIKIMSDFKKTKKYSEYDKSEIDFIKKMIDIIPHGSQN